MNRPSTGLFGGQRTQAAVGKLSLTWAFAELTLDIIVTLLFHCANTPSAPAIPRALSKKIEFSKKCFNSHPKLAAYSAQAKSLLTAIQSLSRQRHIVVHGVAWSSMDVSTIDFRRLEYGNLKHTFESHKLSIDEIEKLADGTEQIGKDLLHLILEIGEKCFCLWINNTDE